MQLDFDETENEDEADILLSFEEKKHRDKNNNYCSFDGKIKKMNEQNLIELNFKFYILYS